MTAGGGRPISGATRLFALLGRPVGHSLSPALHNAWFAEHNIDARYLALDVAPERGRELSLALRTLGLAGANVTVPHKAAMLASLDAVDADAQALGAVNTVAWEGARLVGHNTDARGFVMGFEGRFGATLGGRRVVVLGAGGAALAVALGLLDRGVASVTLLNRTERRVREAVARLLAARPGAAVSAGALSLAGFTAAATGADLVVNALSGGGLARVEELSPTALGRDAVWCDINYWRSDPHERAACAAAGVAFLDGLPMLVYQAALAFEVFTGERPDPLHGFAAVQ